MEVQNKNFKNEHKMASDSLRSALISITTLLACMFIFGFFGTWIMAIVNLPKLISRLGDFRTDAISLLLPILYLFFVIILILFYKKKPTVINNLIYVIVAIIMVIYVWAITRGPYSAKVSYFPGLATVLQTVLIILIAKTRQAKTSLLLSVIFSLIYLSMYFVMIININ